MNQPHYPIFLSGKPDGIDKLEGKSQQKVSRAIVELIKKNNLERKVIGLEGEWGSGKSNVIEMIRDTLGNKYFTFIFDAWGNQEDLTRRTFLEEIIDELFLDSRLINKADWRERKRELLARKSRSIKQFFPKVKTYWIFIASGILFYAFLMGLYENILAQYDLIPSQNYKYWKPLLILYLVPCFFMVSGLILAIREYLNERRRDKEKSPHEQESKLQTLSRIFYWISGSNIESEENENIIEDEPTGREFRKYFGFIQNDFKGEALIIVFDNIDRLDPEKIKALWSSIHTFFAESPYEKTWVIIPYFKEKLDELFDHNGGQENSRGFIEKTFSVNFRVPPPIVSDWEKFLNDKLDEAFGEKNIVKEEREFMVALFDRFALGNTIKPREVINYINQIVALYHQWKSEVESGDIKLRYLALYTLTKDNILKSPADIILNRSYLELSSSLFTEDIDLEDCISALVFGVDKKRAGEVLLKRELVQAIRGGQMDVIKNSKSHRSFVKHFKDAYEDVKVEEKEEHIAAILKSVSDVLPKPLIRNYWKRFSEKVNTEVDFSDNHKKILLNVNDENKTRLLEKVIWGLTKNIEDENNQRKYYPQVNKIRSFLTENRLKVKIESLLNEQILTPEMFLEMLEKEGEEYKKLKIDCNSDKLTNHFYQDDELNIEDAYAHLKSLVILKEDHDLNKISRDLIEFLSTASHTEKTGTGWALEILKSLNKRPISIKLSTKFYSQLSTSVISEEIIADCIAIGISNFDLAYGHPNFQNTLANLSDELQQSVSEVIEWYMDYDDLIDLISTNGNARQRSLKNITYNLTVKSYGISRLYLPNSLSNFSLICETVFDNDSEKKVKFIERLNDWSSRYKSETDFKNMDGAIFEYLNRQDLELIKAITKDAIGYVSEKLSLEDMKSALEVNNRDSVLITSLIKNDIAVNFNDNYITVLEKHLNRILDGEIGLPDETCLAVLLLSKVDGRKLKGIFTRIRNKILADPGKIGYDKIDFFIDGLIRHGSLQKEPEKVAYSLVDYLFKSEEAINSIFVPNVDFFIKTILKSGDYIVDVKTTIVSKFDSIEDEDSQGKLQKKLKLNI
ncbi:MAG: P-loop NTPase fold protein [Reichenbachiella sp.]|uniref:P-loop NTPase fold protein n=1 Tax=Reichenbachiella sp. TaxID=2184521 RepID=UPI0032652535